MFRATIKDRATFVYADAQHPAEVLNAAGDALFRKATEDVDSGDTELAPGASVQLTDSQWFVSAGSSEVTVRELKVGEFEDVTAADDLTVRDDVLVGDALVVEGEAELNGDLNHDGGKAGFFGTAPAARPKKKAPAEVSAKELAEALETLGLLEH